MSKSNLGGIADRLNEVMNEKGITQAELVRRTGINKGALSSYLSARYSPKNDAIDILSEALNVNPLWLMGYDVDKNRLSMRFNKQYNTGEKQVNTVALHYEGDNDFTDEELDDITNFMDYVKSKRKK